MNFELKKVATPKVINRAVNKRKREQRACMKALYEQLEKLSVGEAVEIKLSRKTLTPLCALIGTKYSLVKGALRFSSRSLNKSGLRWRITRMEDGIALHKKRPLTAVVK